MAMLDSWKNVAVVVSVLGAAIGLAYGIGKDVGANKAVIDIVGRVSAVEAKLTEQDKAHALEIAEMNKLNDKFDKLYERFTEARTSVPSRMAAPSPP